MSMVIDKSLDDMIVDKRKSRSSRGSRRGASAPSGPKPTGAATSARARYSGSQPGSNAQVTTRQAAAAASVQAQGGPPSSDKIILSNLPFDVNETQIKDLLTSTVGPLKELNLHYDSNGKSKGIANVTFARRGDGTKAYNEYNNRLIDGKRPMKVELIVDPGRVPPPSLASRVAPVKKAPATPLEKIAAKADAMQDVESGTGSTRGRRAGPGRGRGRGRGGRGGAAKADRPAKSAADLDAEMEDYSASVTSAAAAPTAAV